MDIKKTHISILIKALNEECNIARCLSAAIDETQTLDCEIILVDSLSSDRTVNIARTFPIQIIQFDSQDDCCCGAAVQLGYQYAVGEFLFVLDGDMILMPGFVKQAIEYLEANPTVAGVGGIIIDTQHLTVLDRKRAEHYAGIDRVTFVNSLGGGGLYRRSAIDETGYLSNRNLKACEELELGLRLRDKGWHLVRLPLPAVSHTGHNESGTAMLKRLWLSRRLHAHGTLLRIAAKQPWRWHTIRETWFAFAALTLHLGCTVLTLCLIQASLTPLWAASLSLMLIWGGTFLLLWSKKGSAADSVMAITTWNLLMIATAIGLFGENTDPHEAISAHEIS